MKPQRNKISFLLICICLPVLMKAQQFRYQCVLDTVKQTGFYSIPITPEMSAHMQTDCRDVRIQNGTQPVPYIIRNRNSKTDSLNMMDVGYSGYRNYPSINHYIGNPSSVFIQTDSSNGISYIKVLQQQPFRIDQVRFEIEGPKYFSREVSIVIIKRKPGNKHNYLYELARFKISSSSGFDKLVPVFKTDSFYVTIENGDNPPLTIKNIHTAQEYHELIAWLEAGKQYTIMMDDDHAVAPNYDLQLFKDSIPSVVTSVAVSKIRPVNPIKEQEKNVAFPAKWLWLIMGGAVVLLGILTWRLTSEMRKQ